MITDKANVLCILKILQEYSDKDNILQMKDIVHHMEADYDLSPDRRTVYSAIDILGDLGYEISTYEENKKGYYLKSRDFELSEILLMTDAIYSCPAISGKQTNALVKKLQSGLSANQRKDYKHLTIARDGKKSSNQQVFQNIEILDEAIRKKCKIMFTYLEYNTDKKLVPRREKPYIGSCYGMTYTNDHYYMICTIGDHEDLSLYRIDRMKDIQILDEKCDTKNVDKTQVQNAVYAHVGKPEKIQFRADKSVLSDVIDKFGTDIFIIDDDKDHFIATFQAPADGFRYWAMQYLEHVEVQSPKEIRDKIRVAVESAGEKYGE